MIEYQEKEHTMQNMPIAIFRGDDTDALGYQTIVGTIRTDLDLTGCKAVFKYLSFSVEFNPIPADKKLTVIIPASETAKFPPGLGYASLRVYDAEGKLCTFSNRIMVFVATKTPMFGNEEFEVDFNVRPELEPLKIFVGPNPDDFDEYRGFLEKVIDRASAEKYGLAILLDAIDSDLGAEDGVAATPAAVKAAYAAVIGKLTDDYYTKDETDEAIDRVAAYYITYDAVGHAFPTHADLVNAQTYYSGGKARTPTRNDYAIVLADETHGGSEYRYIYAVAEGETTGSWQPQYPVEGVMTVDQTVTKNSQNPVASSGIWSAIWGALTSLPGFSSIYDWCVATFRNKTDLNVYDDSSRVWTISNCTAPGLGNTINGRYAYSASEQKWLKDGVTDFYIYRDAGQWVLFVRLQGDLPVWTTDSAQGVSGTIIMTGGMTARYTIDVATSWETTDTLAKSSEIVTDYPSLNDKPQINGNELTGNKTGAALGLLDASNGVATGLVTYLGTFNGFEYGLRFGSFGSDYAVQIVARSAGSQTEWTATANLMMQKSKTGYAALLSDIPSVPSASAGTPLMDGTGSAGSSAAFARGDHRHPSDSTKLDKSGGTMTGGLTMGGGNLITFSDSSGTRTMTIGLNSDSFEINLYSYGTLVYTWRTPYNSGVFALASELLNKLDASSASAPFSSDSSVSYPVGSHVTYNGKLYVCTTATTGGTWVAASWTADVIDDPDAVLDITSQNQLRVVAKDGTLLWAQGYDLASTSSATLACDAANNFTFANGATSQAFTLPTAPTGKAGDFGLDIDNSANASAATMTLTGLDTTFSVVVPEGESLNDMLAIAAGELARFYITLSTFRVNNLPTWHIVKQIVENGGATV